MARPRKSASVCDHIVTPVLSRPGGVLLPGMTGVSFAELVHLVVVLERLWVLDDLLSDQGRKVPALLIVSHPAELSAGRTSAPTLPPPREQEDAGHYAHHLKQDHRLRTLRLSMDGERPCHIIGGHSRCWRTPAR